MLPEALNQFAWHRGAPASAFPRLGWWPSSDGAAAVLGQCSHHPDEGYEYICHLQAVSRLCFVVLIFL